MSGSQASIPPPPGYTSNFDNPECDHNRVYVPLSICIGVATILFVARAFTKTYIMKQFDAEDYLLALGWLFEVGFETSAYLRVQCGLSCHQWDLTAATFSCFQFRQYFSNILYSPCIIFLKLSILVQLKRIFTTAARGAVYWLIIALMALNTLFYFIWFVVQIFHCTPIQKTWNPSLPGTCMNLNSGLIFSAVLDMVLNIAMLFLPIWILWKLELKVQQKFRACTIFAIGTIACISSALRIYYTLLVQSSPDVSWNYAGLAWATSLETGSGVIIAAIPVMPRLFKWLRDGDTSRNKNTTGGSSSAPYYSRKPSRVAAGTASDDYHDSIVTGGGGGKRISSGLQGNWIPLKDEAPMTREQHRHGQGGGGRHAAVTVDEL